jgi:hypothetical protein
MTRSAKIRIFRRGASMLFYPGALPLSRQTLTYTAGVIRRHRAQIGSAYVEEINIGPSEALKPVAPVAAVAGKGIRGDRHFDDDGAKPGQALTLIEASPARTPRPPPRLHPAETRPDADHHLIKQPQPPARLYAVASGHRKIVVCCHEPG